MMMTVTKTDPKDACMIAMYGEKMNPPVYKMPSEAVSAAEAEENDYQAVEENVIRGRART